MNGPLAAGMCSEMIEKITFAENLPEYGKAHLRDMIKQMQNWDQEDPKLRDKTMRWLGWLQAAIVIGGGATLEDMKLINKSA